ncbi:Cobyrinic acid A,C-diamide synthase [Dissulfuribacter thermophilus]|uniref:Cobyrinate a,c-diamide synthase n=1 Tax=Dissulfuribacter thermophilus TaxID=1156395 RepID=A0A1B9F970_9BACT|nr:cobyrinate a,c-diamide synthase [Dissulfuribacter thermophilus]OCC16467.1 Cobyrinic acid A,C-diamide synthase [Dissulfuribacter thermophilus]
MDKQYLYTPRIVISAFRGGAGKTVASLGITRAIKDLGLKVSSFKKGPDYIDAKWLKLASGGPCYNLDPFLMDNETIKASFISRAQGADIAIVEGNRGLYDGVDIEGTSSTAELAKLINAPVIVILDCTKMTRTAAALALGLKNLDPDVKIKGIVLNHIVRARHERIVRQSIETYTGIKVLGVIPRFKKDPMPMRHLGVTPVEEHPDAENSISSVSKMIQENIDIDAVIDIAKSAGPLALSDGLEAQSVFHCLTQPKRVRIGVLMDEAFQFYYPENLEALQKNGAQIEFISAINTPKLPDIDLLYIGGGFPETQAEKLSKNEAFKKSVKEAIENGLPVYAECGGLMYLGRSITHQGNTYPMVGAIDYDFLVEKRPQGHGYSILKVERPTPFYEEGFTLKGHEFHYSRPIKINTLQKSVLSCSVMRGHGFDGKEEGVLYKNLFATYTHVHALQQKDFGIRLTRVAASYSGLRAEPRPLPWLPQAR